jgi:hypothetical protein
MQAGRKNCGNTSFAIRPGEVASFVETDCVSVSANIAIINKDNSEPPIRFMTPSELKRTPAQTSYYADEQRPVQPRRATTQTSNDLYSPDELLRRRATTRTDASPREDALQCTLHQPGACSADPCTCAPLLPKQRPNTPGGNRRSYGCSGFVPAYLTWTSSRAFCQRACTLRISGR